MTALADSKYAEHVKKGDRHNQKLYCHKVFEIKEKGFGRECLTGRDWLLANQCLNLMEQKLHPA